MWFQTNVPKHCPSKSEFQRYLFVAWFVIAVFVVVSSNSDDSVSLSGSKSELDLDDIFGESDEDDNDFQEFLNKKFQLKFSVKGCEKLTTTANILHHLMRQMLALLEITQGRTQPRILVCFRMKKFLSTLTHEPTGMPLRSKAKICGSTELHGPLWKTQVSFEHFLAYGWQ